MATSVYFNNFSPAYTNQQRLMEDVIVESIKIMGHDVKYLPRESYDDIDQIMGESPESKFSRAYTIEMYIANVEGFEGEGDLFSKFGLEIRDTSNFIVSRKSFERYIPSSIAIRPREGDLIYVPVMQKIFEIKFVENELMFKSIGNRNPYIYELRCEAFRYSQENFETGDQVIDDIKKDTAYTINLNVADGSDNFNIDEIVYQGANIEYALATARVSNWEPTTKVLSVRDIAGVFTDNVAIIGTESNTSRSLINFDPLKENVYYDDYDNSKLQTEAADYIDLSEINPFGMP